MHTCQNQICTALEPSDGATRVRNTWQLLVLTQGHELICGSLKNQYQCLFPRSYSFLMDTDRVHDGDDNGAISGEIQKRRMRHFEYLRCLCPGWEFLLVLEN